MIPCKKIIKDDDLDTHDNCGRLDKMKKVAVLTDSTCCLPKELVSKYGIELVPLTIIHKCQSYRDGIDISPGEVYRIMREKKDLPTTSTPSAGEFLDIYQRLSLNVESMLCITLTGKQSKTYEAALMAGEQLKQSNPDTAIEVIDSRAVSGALGFIVLEAARAVNEGAGLGQAADIARGMIGRVNHLAILDTLYFLARTGRVGRAAAWAGSILDLKPVLEHSTSAGETVPAARPRTRAKAIERMLDIMAERVGSSMVHAIVHHTDEPEEGEKLKAEIGLRFQCIEHYITEYTPVMGVHAGPGVLAVSFYTD
jgi:DegV family protein with EDD domain